MSSVLAVFVCVEEVFYVDALAAEFVGDIGSEDGRVGIEA